MESDITTTLGKAYDHVRAAYTKLEDMGATMPAQKNLQNLAITIRSLPTGPQGPSADNPLLEDLKEVLASDDPASIYPVGIEIPDTWNGEDNPLIVAQYLNSSNNTLYNGAEGVILIRKYIAPTDIQWKTASEGANPQYPYANLAKYLNGEYLNKCSDTLKSIISPIAYTYGHTDVTAVTTYIATQTFVAPSMTEVGAANNYGGIFFDYFKQAMNTTTIIASANMGRAFQKLDKTYGVYWLRTNGGQYYAYTIGPTGAVSSMTTSENKNGVLPWCFVAKG